MNAQPILCQFNMDTSCVEALYPDHSKLSIGCDLIEGMSPTIFTRDPNWTT